MLSHHFPKKSHQFIFPLSVPGFAHGREPLHLCQFNRQKYDILILTCNSLASSELEPFLFSMLIAYLCFIYRLSFGDHFYYGYITLFC